jgi:hypothetical protein
VSEFHSFGVGRLKASTSTTLSVKQRQANTGNTYKGHQESAILQFYILHNTIMPRFSDQWLIDRTLFDYVQGGSCSCCSFNFLPGGTAGLIQSMSELETDAANEEVRALDKLPWPPEMKDQVWMERVRLRQYCKRTMKQYKQFWEEHGEAYEQWFYQQSKSELCRYFQLPRTEILERLQQDKFHMHASFGTVLCAVTEQGM